MLTDAVSCAGAANVGLGSAIGGRILGKDAACFNCLSYSSHRIRLLYGVLGAPERVDGAPANRQECSSLQRRSLEDSIATVLVDSGYVCTITALCRPHAKGRTLHAIRVGSCSFTRSRPSRTTSA